MSDTKVAATPTVPKSGTAKLVSREYDAETEICIVIPKPEAGFTIQPVTVNESQEAYVMESRDLRILHEAFEQTFEVNESKFVRLAISDGCLKTLRESERAAKMLREQIINDTSKENPKLTRDEVVAMLASNKHFRTIQEKADNAERTATQYKRKKF